MRAVAIVGIVGSCPPGRRRSGSSGESCRPSALFAVGSASTAKSAGRRFRGGVSAVGRAESMEGGRRWPEFVVAVIGVRLRAARVVGSRAAITVVAGGIAGIPSFPSPGPRIRGASAVAGRTVGVGIRCSCRSVASHAGSTAATAGCIAAVGAPGTGTIRCCRSSPSTASGAGRAIAVTTVGRAPVGATAGIRCCPSSPSIREARAATSWLA